MNLANLDLREVSIPVLEDLRTDIYITELSSVNLSNMHLSDYPFSDDDDAPLQGNIIFDILLHLATTHTLKNLILSYNNLQDAPQIFDIALDTVHFCRTMRHIDLQHCILTPEQFTRFVDAVDHNEGITKVILTPNPAYRAADIATLSHTLKMHWGALEIIPSPAAAYAVSPPLFTTFAGISPTTAPPPSLGETTFDHALTHAGEM